MKKIKLFSAVIFSVATLMACQKNVRQETLAAPLAEEANGVLTEERSNRGHVYTLSNQVSGNSVVDYAIGEDGSLMLSGTYATGQNGTGGGLGNQGAVIISMKGDVLLAVNAGSNSISSFKITGNGLSLKSTISSGGMRPVSVTEHNGIVYVLNAGGTGNISGFRLENNDKLSAIYNSTRPLSSTSAGAAQVSFVRNGSVLVITEKATNKIITYKVNDSGMPTTMSSITSSTPTPFGFAVGESGKIYVSEAVGGAPGASTISSYQISVDGSIAVINGSVSAAQTAACWVVLSGDGRYAYATNTASNNISSFNVYPNSGNLGVYQAIATTTDMGPIDASISANSKYLYVLNRGSNTIGAYEVAENGSLSFIENVQGVPAGATGMAAR